MTFDIRKVFVILAVSIIFALFSFALFDAFYPSVKYDDYCKDRYNIYANNSESCNAIEGSRWVSYNDRKPINVDNTVPNGYCDTTYQCNLDFTAANDKRSYAGFIFLSILGAIAIILGINLPMSNPINEWIGTGFMLGGLFDIFIGTGMYYQDLGRYARPLVLFIEMGLIIFLTYLKLGEKKQSKKKGLFSR